MQPLWACCRQEDCCYKCHHHTQWTEDPHPPANHLPGQLPIPAVLQEDWLYDTILGLHHEALAQEVCRAPAGHSGPFLHLPCGPSLAIAGTQHQPPRVHRGGEAGDPELASAVSQGEGQNQCYWSGDSRNLYEFVKRKHLCCIEDLV